MEDGGVLKWNKQLAKTSTACSGLHVQLGLVTERVEKSYLMAETTQFELSLAGAYPLRHSLRIDSILPSAASISTRASKFPYREEGKPVVSTTRKRNENS